MADLGNFGNVSPDAMGAIREALSRRQQGDSVPALNQQSGASVSSAPLPAQPVGGVDMPAQQTRSKAPSTEAEIIVKALDSRLKSISTKETSPNGGLI